MESHLWNVVKGDDPIATRRGQSSIPLSTAAFLSAYLDRFLVWGLRAAFHLMVRPMVEYLGIATGENSKVITKLSFEARTIEV